VTKQMLPDGQLTDPGAEVQPTVPQATVWTTQLPPEQVAWARPVLGSVIIVPNRLPFRLDY
jgi:hypothetical protein